MGDVPGPHDPPGVAVPQAHRRPPQIDAGGLLAQAAQALAGPHSEGLLPRRAPTGRRGLAPQRRAPGPGHAHRAVGGHRDLERVAAHDPGPVGAKGVDGMGLHVGHRPRRLARQGVGDGQGPRTPGGAHHVGGEERHLELSPLEVELRGAGAGVPHLGPHQPARALRIGDRPAGAAAAGLVHLASGRVGDDEAHRPQAQVADGVRRDPRLGHGAPERRSGADHGGRGYVDGPVARRQGPFLD